MCSCFDTKLKEKFLRISDLTVEKIAELGLLYENSRLQAREIAGDKDTQIEEIHFTRKSGKNTNISNRSHLMKPVDFNRRNCFNCGNVYTSNHKPQCQAAGKKCDFCGILGHFQAVCHKQKKIFVARKSRQKRIE